jgi:hypothetical protein
MPFSDALRCPQCLSPLSLRSLGPFALRGLVVRDTPNLGVECPHCGAKLRIVRTRLFVTQGILFALFFFGLRGLVSLKKTGHLDAVGELQLLCLLSALLGTLLLQLFTPNLLQVRLVGAGEAVTFPLGTPKADEDATAGWICNNCHEKNPEDFEICWKCEHARPKAPASNNRWRGP